jgi:hypothetical protein
MKSKPTMLLLRKRTAESERSPFTCDNCGVSPANLRGGHELQAGLKAQPHRNLGDLLFEPLALPRKPVENEMDIFS